MNAPDPLSVAVGQRVQAEAGDSVPELNPLVPRARKQEVTTLQVRHCAYFVLVGGERLGDLVSLQIPKLDGEIS